MDFFGDFKLRDTFQERIVPKSIEIGMHKLHVTFSALDIDFNGPVHDLVLLCT